MRRVWRCTARCTSRALGQQRKKVQRQTLAPGCHGQGGTGAGNALASTALSDRRPSAGGAAAAEEGVDDPVRCAELALAANLSPPFAAGGALQRARAGIAKQEHDESSQMAPRPPARPPAAPCAPAQLARRASSPPVACAPQPAAFTCAPPCVAPARPDLSYRTPAAAIAAPKADRILQALSEACVDQGRGLVALQPP